MSSDSYVIETVNLTKKFGDFTAVRDLSLKIRQGEIFGFLGPNGAGKTTAIRMVVGLLQPTSGTVELRNGDGAKIEDRVGICPQDIVIWEELTCYENIRFMGEMYDVPSAELPDRTEKLLSDLKLDEKRDSPAAELSGGMKRRLNLGMSLIHEPEIVVLDEPSAGLDPQSRYSLWEYINDLRKNESDCIILTTHLMEEADRLSDRVGIIDRGELLVVDEPEALKKSVGEGDSIKIELVNEAQNTEAADKLESLPEVLETKVIEGKLIVRAHDAVGQMARFTETVENAGFAISDVTISRTNTLEDVFIHLTGRGLKS